MARLARYYVEGQPQHIIQRGNNREVIFALEEDYVFYKECLRDAIEKYALKIHAYVLMTNHVHLLATPEHENSIPKTLQSVGRRYVQYFNYTYDRTGTLWEGRYKATLIDTEQYLLTCMRYIELNSIRANMVDHPSEYPYSSYLSNAKGKKDALIQQHLTYKRLGRTEQERQKQYRQLFRTSVSKIQLESIRNATNKGWVLGNDRLREKIEKLSGRRAAPKKPGRPKKEKN